MVKIADILSVNKTFELQVNGEGIFHKCSVHEINSEYIAVRIPSRFGNVVNLLPGDNIKGRAYTSDAQYLFNSTVLGKKFEKGVLYLLAVPSKLKRVQLRDHVRVQVVLPVKYRSFRDIGNDESFKETFSIDLSGGGINILMEETVAVNSLLDVQFMVKDAKDKDVVIQAIARVIRKEAVKDSKKETLGLSFEEISENDRDILIGFLFRKLLEQRRLEVDEP